MRNMLQLLGGVAVAGVVAAGSTAFTASGVTSTIGTGAGAGKIVVGGKVAQQTVVGAVLTSAVFTMDGTDPDRVMGVSVNLAGASSAVLSTASTVTVKITGSAGGSTASGDVISCLNASATQWDCDVPGTDYYTAVSALDVTVVAA